MKKKIYAYKTLGPSRGSSSL